MFGAYSTGIALTHSEVDESVIKTSVSVDSDELGLLSGLTEGGK